MPRAIDHLVLAVPDLAAAQDLYRRLGFTVGGRNRHPWGTENAVVQLDGAYLELIGLAEGFSPPAPDDPAAPFALPVAAAVGRGGGLVLVALASGDADADAARFRAAGLGAGRRLDFARTAVGPDGAERVLRFGLAFAEVPGLPEAGLFSCRHHQPFGDAGGRRHENGAARLDAVILAGDAPDALAATLAPLFDAAPGGPAGRPAFATPTGRMDVMAPGDAAAHTGARAAPGRFAGFTVVVDALPPLRERLARAGLPHAEVGGALAVPPEAAFGLSLAFALAPCHSGPDDGDAA